MVGFLFVQVKYKPDIVKIFISMLLACFLGISSIDAQDFVQPVKIESARIKKPKVAHKDKTRNRVEIKDLDYQHFKLSVNVGYSDHTYQMAEKIPSPLTEYVKDLKSGSNFGMDFLYYPVEPVGFGIKYSAFSGRSSKAVFTSPSKYITTNKDLFNQFIGPCISTRYLHADMKNALYFNMAYGYIDYWVDYHSSIDFYAKGNTMATVYDLGYDFGLTQNIGVGFQISYIRGILKEYKSTYNGEIQNVYLEYGKYEKLHRLDFSIGLKLNL